MTQWQSFVNALSPQERYEMRQGDEFSMLRSLLYGEQVGGTVIPGRLRGKLTISEIEDLISDILTALRS
jgi:hypothetical protein